MVMFSITFDINKWHNTRATAQPETAIYEIKSGKIIFDGLWNGQTQCHLGSVVECNYKAWSGDMLNYSKDVPIIVGTIEDPALAL